MTVWEEGQGFFRMGRLALPYQKKIVAAGLT
jgi:hypothetical protein